MKNTKKTTRGVRPAAAAVAFAAFAAVPFMADAEQKTVAAGATTVVAATDVASWASADIDIGAGATLLFEEPDANAEFTGKITGAGHFVAHSAVTTTKPYEFKMNGDATGFTGGFFYTNVLARICTPTSVGDSAAINMYVVYNTGNGAKSHFFGPAAGQPDYVYRNPLDVRVGANNGLVVNARTVLAGDIVHRYGVIHGPGKITGKIKTYASALPFAGDLHVEGPCTAEVANAKISNEAQSLYMKGTTHGFSTFVVCNCNTPVYLEGDNLFDENVVLQLGENYTGDEKKSGRLELNGHSQTFKRAWFRMDAGVPESLRQVGGIGNTGAPATVTFANNDAAKWFYGALDGHLSVCVTGPNMIGFVGPTNTIDGTITASGGNVVIAGSYPKLKSLVSCNGGILDIRSSASFNPRLGLIEIDDTSKVKVANGLTVNVRRLCINGVDVPIGSYTKNTSGPTSGHFDNTGTGTIKVTGVPGFAMSVR